MSRECDQGYEKIALILDVLGSTAALKIFDEAAKGFKSGKKTIRKLGLTPRKYYRYLKRLNELEIVAPSAGSYNLTPVGKYLHKLFLLNDALTVLSTDLKLLDAFQKIGDKSELTIVYNYNDLVKLVNAAIEQSKSEILLATRYLDLSVTQILIRALQRGVKLKLIANKNVDFLNFLKLINSFTRNIRPNITKSHLSGTNCKVGDVPLSFVLIDDEIGIFEPPTKEFKIAFMLTNERAIKMLSDLFLEIWNRSQRL